MTAGEACFRPIYIAYDEDRSVANIASSRDGVDLIKDMYGKAGFEVGAALQ